MAETWKSVLSATLLLMAFQTGEAIKCYDCDYVTGDVPANMKDIVKDCINKNPKDCPADVNNCYRATEIVKSPVKYEANHQSCGRIGKTAADLKCTPWPAVPGAELSGAECYCAGDLCNSATKLIDSRLPLVVWIIFGAVSYSTFF
ncbi:uncharacterized protein LOC129596016 [Paramacrobiotus metropolitanus]|uniref:uncharacterized protein LOC129596016 n=1 Tax=Paramacrobiotus metropolitanus TaxID=2943436 RepID=UPI002445DF10|nr:uncharacterized protein LOC129596016 [Paramacrobiotus metropolitanus]